MDVKTINGIEVRVVGEISDEELSVYLNQIQAKKNHRIINAAVIVDGEYIDVKSTFEIVPFERIRRITGYLVGTTDRWCDAKQAEERDRVKHH